MASLMKNTNDEQTFLEELKHYYQIVNINSTSHDIAHLIDNLVVFESPDFVFGENYVEKFKVDNYKRQPNKKGKMASKHRSDDARLNRRVEIPQDIFCTTHYYAPDERTNTRYLKNNIEELISEKTEKQTVYATRYPNARYKHLFIELKCRSQIYTDDSGNYFSEVVSEDGLHLEYYEVYRDYNFMMQVKKQFSDCWDLLIFVDRFQNRDGQLYYLYCFDLKQEIDKNRMKQYPDRIFQIMKGAQQVYHLQGGVSTTNVRYQIAGKAGSIHHLDTNEININNITMTKHEFMDAVYVSEDSGFLIETSQKVCAINPDSEIWIMARYIPFLLQDKLILSYETTSIELCRVTPTCEFFYRDGDMGYFKINDKTWLTVQLL